MKPFFHRNRPEPEIEIKKHKKFRHSTDAPNSSRPKLSQDPNRLIRKEPNPSTNKSRKENSFATKPTLQSSLTAKNSLNATKTNSPFKGSSACIPMLEPVISTKSFKFYYQIGLGAFGKVWKVQERATDKEYAMKELLKAR